MPQTASYKILIIRLSSIGDIVLASPLIRAVHKQYPNAIIDFAIKKEFAVLMRHNPNINNLIIVDSSSMKESIESVKNGKYDWIIDIQKASRASQLINGAGAKLVTSYNKQRWNRFFLINFKWNKYKENKPVYQRYFEAVEQYNVKDDGEGTEIFITDIEEKKINSILAENKIDTGKPLITICPGAKFANKTWSKEGFIELAKKLQTEHNANIALLGGPDENALCNEIAVKTRHGASPVMPGIVVNLAGQLSLLESAALLKKSQLVIANDSGLMHMAQSQKTPVITIFGPTVKQFGFYPIEKDSTVIETNLGCRPCTKMGMDKCPKGHHKCMKDISVDMVYEPVKKYIH